MTVGAPAPWLARRLRLTPDRFLIGGRRGCRGRARDRARVVPRTSSRTSDSPLAQFDLRAAATAAPARRRARPDAIAEPRGHPLDARCSACMLVLAAVAVGRVPQRGAARVDHGDRRLLVEFLKIEPAAAARHARRR